MRLKNNVFFFINIIALLFIFIVAGCGGGGSSSNSRVASGTGTGKGGSMSRFAIIDNYLYTVSGSNLKLFTFTPDFSGLNIDATVSVGRNIETLYSGDKYLFIGAQDGVYIYNTRDPSNPIKESKFRHIQSCDPVVVSGQYAYVTLRNNSGSCRLGDNKLDVLDLSDIKNPRLVKSFAMQNPKGLGIANGLLFVCDDFAGLKVYDLNGKPEVGLIPGIPIRIATDKTINCYDLIPNQNKLVISDKTGILQYGYDINKLNSPSLTKISEILQISAKTPR